MSRQHAERDIFHRFDHHAAECGAVAGEVFGRRVDDDVGAETQRVAQERGWHGVVDHERHAVRMRDLGDSRDVEHRKARVAERFGKHRAGVWPHRGGESFRARRIDEARIDAELRQVDREHRHRATVQRAGRDDVVAVLQDRHQRHRLGRHAAGRRDRRAAAFERGAALFERSNRRVRQARIHIAEGLQIEQRRCVVGAVEDEARRLVNRQGARAGCGIRDLAGVNRQRFGVERMIGHATSDGWPRSRAC